MSRWTGGGSGGNRQQLSSAANINRTGASFSWRCVHGCNQLGFTGHWPSAQMLAHWPRPRRPQDCGSACTTWWWWLFLACQLLPVHSTFLYRHWSTLMLLLVHQFPWVWSQLPPLLTASLQSLLCSFAAFVSQWLTGNYRARECNHLCLLISLFPAAISRVYGT